MQQFSERDVARRWASGELIGQPLRTTNGERLTVLYPGRPGGPAGPDFRDAVIRLGDERTLCGDVEVHLRGGDWRAHGHQGDPRYRGVILHVVWSNDLQPTRLADGVSVPVLALAEVAPPPTLPLRPREHDLWPCQHEETRLAEPALLKLLDEAGEARFLEKAAAFEAQLADTATQTPAPQDAASVGWNVESRLLFAALAEGVGYGRSERQAFQAVGEQLMALAPTLTSPAHAYEGLLARLKGAARLDRERLAALIRLAVRWRADGPWPQFWGTLSRRQSDNDLHLLLQALMASGATYQVSTRPSSTPSESLSEERALILIWNVVLPFTYGWARLHDDDALANRALLLAGNFPGLPSNQVTRAQQKQLLLPKHPRMALAQQGLHHIHRHWCREKRCSACPCAKAE